jgi:site-specific DNA recombinase
MRSPGTSVLTCGICGGGYTIRAKDRYGCATRGRQGTCSNTRTISRQELERRVLDGLQGSLLTPELVAEFITETSVSGTDFSRSLIWRQLPAN